MNSGSPEKDVYLKPGELHFTNRRVRIRTILGSCVSVVLWHPQLRAGGMCHFMLPGRGLPAGSLDGRYADEAMLMLLENVDLQGADRREYQVKLFGGSRMFETSEALAASVGQRNAEVARDMITAHGFQIACEHLGGVGHRNLVFNVWSGDVWMKHIPYNNPVMANRTVNQN